MKSKIAGLFLFCFIFSISLNAQEPKEQEKETPKPNFEKKLAQTVENFASTVAVSVIYIKSLGKTPDDYGQFIGEAFAPLWKEAKGKGIAPLYGGVVGTLRADTTVKVEILNQSKDFIEAKINRFGNAFVKNFLEAGLTLEEYDSVFGKCFEAIGNYLGLEYKQKTEGDWIFFSIAQKKAKGN
jgi:hypothetical protein